MTISDGWNRITTWDLVLPPSRPSQMHLNWFRAALNERSRDEPVAILGSTPELRDLVSEQGFEHIYVFERNDQMFDMMTEMRIHNNHEHRVSGDWLEQMPQYKNMFGLILSDLTSGNIEYEKRPVLYSAIAEALNHDGVFADKVLSHNQPLFDVNERLSNYEFTPLNLETINRFNCEIFFYSDLVDTYQCVDSTAFYDELHRRTRSPRLLRILRELPKITPPNMKWHYGQPWHQVSSYYEHTLTLVKEAYEEPESPYAHGLRLTAWKRK